MPRRRTVSRKQIQAPNWDAHEVVFIRSLRDGDNQDIQDALAAMSPGEKADMKLALGTSRRLTMLHGIESWTLTNEDGSPLPLCEQSIRDLAPEDADYIYKEINDLNAPMTESEKKDSLKSA
jgi:hypothetical protein